MESILTCVVLLHHHRFVCRNGFSNQVIILFSSRMCLFWTFANNNTTKDFVRVVSVEWHRRAFVLFGFSYCILWKICMFNSAMEWKAEERRKRNRNRNEDRNGEQYDYICQPRIIYYSIPKPDYYYNRILLKFLYLSDRLTIITIIGWEH